MYGQSYVFVVIFLVVQAGMPVGVVSGCFVDVMIGFVNLLLFVVVATDMDALQWSAQV